MFEFSIQFSLLAPVKSASFPTHRQLHAQVVELVDTHDSESCAARCGGSSPPLGTKEGRIMRSFFVTNGSDENEVRRSYIRSEEGITRSVSPKDLNRSRLNPIPLSTSLYRK